jgi:hypothetical protein
MVNACCCSPTDERRKRRTDVLMVFEILEDDAIVAGVAGAGQWIAEEAVQCSSGCEGFLRSGQPMRACVRVSRRARGATTLYSAPAAP